MNRLLRQLRLVGVLGVSPHSPARAVAPVDLGDTSRCPLRERCQGCGRDVDDLAVRAFDLAVHAFDFDSLGTACLTLCPTCVTSTVSLRVGNAAAVALVLQHADHVGAGVATEKLLQRWFHDDNNGVVCRPRPSPADPP